MQPIPCSEQLPEEGDTVMFWLSPDQGNYSHGSIMIGNFDGAKRYVSTKRIAYKFSTPGHGWEGTHWCEIPEHLKNFKPNEATTHC
jgi:hypothetical protein